MSYNTDHLRTAGKITVYTTLIGLVSFAVIFIFNLGETHIKQVDAQSNATTSVTVLNTPPQWTATTTEVTESSTSTPTNVGDGVSWTAVGTDSNGEDYYLLICSTGNAATATSDGAPTCNGGVQWAVSASTTSGVAAVVSTTTTAVAPFTIGDGESFPWFAFICDGNSGTPRCNSAYTQGTNPANSSPFEVNHRPLFSIFADNSPADPGQTVTFTSTASDADSSGSNDTVQLIVCAGSGFNTGTDTCTGDTLATSTFAAADPSAAYTIVVPTQDQDYSAVGYVIDNHGFESSDVAQDTDSTLSVNNVAPTVTDTTISLVQSGTTDIVLTTESGETTGFTLSFTTVDDNSCDATPAPVGDEVIGFDLSIYRSGAGVLTSSSTTCPVTGPYDENRCYPSSATAATWNLNCTAATTTCSGSSDPDMEWDCTFPMWYVADPTDGNPATTQYSSNDWRAQVRAIDDGQDADLVSVTGPLSESSTGVDVTSLLGFALDTLSIPYGSLEPGDRTDLLVATTTISATGNVGLDKDVQGTSMCESYTGATPCAPSLTSTIPANMQVFATSTVSYGTASSTGDILSSTTPQEIEINVPKSIATSSAASADAFWGIAVPGSITYSGDYTGENTFTALVGEPADW